MKTPWSELVKYGVGTATLLVVALGGLIILTTIGVAVLLAKFLTYIK